MYTGPSGKQYRVLWYTEGTTRLAQYRHRRDGPLDRQLLPVNGTTPDAHPYGTEHMTKLTMHEIYMQSCMSMYELGLIRAPLGYYELHILLVHPPPPVFNRPNMHCANFKHSMAIR